MAFLLAACSVSTPSAKVFVGDCFGPGSIPNRKITQAEVEHFWGQDRKHLVQCKDIVDKVNKINGKK